MPPLLKRLGGERFRSRKRIFRQTSFRLTMLVGRNFKKRYVVFRIVPHGAKKYFEWAVFRNREGGSQPPYKRRFFSIFLAAVWARNMVPVRHEDKGGHLMRVKFESQFVHWTPAFSAAASVGASATRRLSGKPLTRVSPRKKCPLDTFCSPS